MKELEDSLREFLDNYGIYYQERANSFTLECPQCSANKLDLHKHTGKWICYKCGDFKGPAAETILSEISGEVFNKIKREIRGTEFIQNIDLASVTKETKVIDKKQVEEKQKFLPRYFLPIVSPKSAAAREYLNKRGIPDFLSVEMGLLFNPVHQQVIFPVYEGREYCGYQARAIEGSLKYNNIDKSKYLMFNQTITSNIVILAEGPISALKFAQCGAGFIASMGKSVSETQVQKLTAAGVDTIYLALDRDAYREIQAFYKKYFLKFKIFLVEVPEHRSDFGDSTFLECVESFKSAMPLNNMSFLPGLE